MNKHTIRTGGGAPFLKKSEIHLIYGIQALYFNYVLLQAYMPSFSGKKNQSVSIRMKEQ